MTQAVVVAVLVAGCGAYVVWTVLLSAALRSRLAMRALQLPTPAPLRRALQRQVDATNSCGCNGCDKAVPAQQQRASQPVHIVRRIDRDPDRRPLH